MNKQEILNSFPNCPGIYKITNIINNKCYIGQAFLLRKRIRQHYNLWTNPKIKKYLYSSINKYGIENFKFELIETIENTNLTLEEVSDLLDKKEIFYIKELNSLSPNGYNETPGGKSSKAFFTKEFKEKISKSLKEYYKTHTQKTAKCCVAFNFKEKYFIYAKSRAEMSELLKEKGYNINKTTISSCINKFREYILDFVFGISEAECLNKYSNITKLNVISPKPTKEKFLEYLKSTVDKNGFLPSLSEIANHYNRKSNTVGTWINNWFSDIIKLNKTYRRLYLIGFSNENIDYGILDKNYNLNKRIKNKGSILYNILNIKTNISCILDKHEGAKYFNISESTFNGIVYRSKKGNIYKDTYIVTKITD